MADPTPYQPGFNYSNWQATNPTKPLPGQQVDNDFANIKRSVNESISAIRDVRRSDGKLKNGIVGPDSLSSALSLGFTLRGTWVPGIQYQAGDGVVLDQVFYSARVSHLSSAGTAPGNVTYWNLLFSLEDIVVSGALSMPVNVFSGNGTQTEFDLSFTPISARNLLVMVGGLPQAISEYAVEENTLVFDVAPNNGYEIEVRGFATTAAMTVPAEGSVTRDSLNAELETLVTLAGTALQPGDAATPAQGAKADTAVQPATLALKTTWQDAPAVIDLTGERAVSFFYNGVLGPSVDGSDAFETAIRSGRKIVVDTPFRLTRKITANGPSQNFQQVSVSGIRRGGSIILDAATAGVEIEIGPLTDGSTRQVVMRDLILVPNGLVTGTGIRLQSNGGVTDGTEKTAVLDNISAVPMNGFSSLVKFISMHNMRGGIIRDCLARGSGIQSGSIAYEVTGDPSVVSVENALYNNACHFYEQACSISGATEGIAIRDNTFAACFNGLKVRSNNSSMAIKFSISGNKILVRDIAVDCEDIKDTAIYDNQLYGAPVGGFPVAFVGIKIRRSMLTAASAEYNRVFSNVINGAAVMGQPGVIVARGLDLNGNGVGNSASDYGPNTYAALDQGIFIDTNVRLSKFHNDDTFIGVTTPLINTAPAGTNFKVSSIVSL